MTRVRQDRQTRPLRLSAEIISQVEALAKQHKRSFNSEVAWALEQYIKAERKYQPMQYDAERKAYVGQGTEGEIAIDEATYEAQLEAYVEDGMPREEAVATVRKPDVWEQVLLK